MATGTDFGALWAKAHAAGHAAATAVTPRAMVVSQHADMLDDSSPTVKSWYVSEGACGFAWVVFKGNTPFGRWAKKTGKAHSHYPSGLSYWVGDYGQSMARKEAYAHAFARALRDGGVADAYSSSRMD